MRVGLTNPKKQILKNIDITLKWLKDSYFFNCDFRDFFKKMVYKNDVDKCFCYCDPPYLGTGDNYSDSFTEKDSEDLFKTLIDSGVKFAISEFNNPIILKSRKSITSM